MSEELIRQGPHVPTEERALERLRRAIDQSSIRYVLQRIHR
jgi:hypothetical protein